MIRVLIQSALVAKLLMKLNYDQLTRRFKPQPTYFSLGSVDNCS